MKKKLLLLLAIIASLFLKAQTPATADLDINNVKATIVCGASMFNNNATTAAYEYPKGVGRHSMFASGLWIGGYESSTNQLKVAASSYGVVPKRDFWAGPLNANGQVDTYKK